jgi:hypothetical protein
LRLCLTYAGEAAIPLFVLGLYAAQRPRIGRLGLFGAIAYAYSYVFFTATVVYALAAGTRNYPALVKVFGASMTVHGLIMLVGGLAFGLAVVRAGVLPRWTGVCLMVGVVLVAAASGLPNIARALAETVPAIAFIGMGFALLNERRTFRAQITSMTLPAAKPRLDGASTDDAYVDLYWLPLGAGGRSVRWNGRIFEALVSHHERRPVRDLYHSALEVGVDGRPYVIEMGPAWGTDIGDRDVACEGAVGSRWLGRSRYFRYQVRSWRNGVIPDIGEAVDSPHRLTTDSDQVRELLELVAHFPTETWGRDELHTGDMWNSNSLTAWLLSSIGLRMDDIRPPAGGRAPGWTAGLVVARRRPLLHPQSPAVRSG